MNNTKIRNSQTMKANIPTVMTPDLARLYRMLHLSFINVSILTFLESDVDFLSQYDFAAMHFQDESKAKQMVLGVYKHFNWQKDPNQWADRIMFEGVSFNALSWFL